MHVQTLARYNRWMNRKVYGCGAGLSDEARKRDMGAFFRSIHGTLNHLLLADRVWMGRFTGAPFQVGSLDQELYADFSVLRNMCESEDGRITEWVASLSPRDMEGELAYTSLVNPEPRRYPLWLDWRQGAIGERIGPGNDRCHRGAVAAGAACRATLRTP